ncbi:MAG: hypothetical protein ABW204_07495 [Microbacteriaceae bacterium]
MADTSTEALPLEAELDRRSATLNVLGRAEQLEGETPAHVRDQVVARAAAIAYSLGRPVRLRIRYTFSEVTQRVIVDIDGTVSADVSPEPAAQGPIPATAPQPAAQPTAGGAPPAVAPSPQPAPTRRPRPERAGTPAEQLAGLRFLAPRSVAVISARGGLGKTTATACLAAAYAQHVDTRVLAWDNSATAGTLAWRSEQRMQVATVQSLLPKAAELLPLDVWRGHIEPFVHQQFDDGYDVLQAGSSMLDAGTPIGEVEYDTLHALLTRHYGLSVIDSDNALDAPRWLRMVLRADQLVIACSTRHEAVETTLRMLQELRSVHPRALWLAENAVVVLTGNEQGSFTAKQAKERFAGHVRAVEQVPFDPALVDGQYRFNRLGRRTQAAWLKVAAVATERF